MEEVARQITGGMANAELHKQTERDSEERRILAEIGRVISSSIDPEQVFDEFSDLVRELLPAERVTFAAIDHDSGSLVMRVSGADLAITGRTAGDVVSSQGSLTAHVIDSKSVFTWTASDNDGDLPAEYPGLIPFLNND